MSENSFNIHEWEKEKMDALVKYNHYKDGVSDGFEDGFDKATTNTIQEMLKKNISLQDISDITGKSIDEINNVKKSLNNN